MSILTIGINYKTAPVIVREQIYFAADKLSLYLQDLLNTGHAQEAVLLSTCNRSELYCEAQDIAAVKDWFFAQTTIPRQELEPLTYEYHDAEAVAHIIQVACGLDSMVLGEPQILGQMKTAFSESCAASAINASFQRLFQQVFATAKEIRTATAIGACPVSVASAAAHFAKQHIALHDAHVAIIGAGDTTELLLRYLKTQVLRPMTVINRSLDKAVVMAEAHGGFAYGLDQLVPGLQNADIVFSATGSALPIVTREAIVELMHARQNKPIILIDIAVPRDIDPSVGEIAGVSLFGIDDLKMIIEQNKQGREHAAVKARELVRIKSVEFINEQKSLDKVTHAIRAYRGQIESICRAELLKARQQLSQGVAPEQVLDEFAHAFIKKLLHTPSVQLRQAGVEGRFELLNFAKQLFAIPDHELERL